MAITLKQIAEKAGVSIRTVNRALKEQAGISDIKRQEILEAASRMGYIPNIAARNLRLRKSNFVGIMAGINENDIFIRKSHDLQQRLEMHGFFPIIGILQDSPETVRAMLSEWAGMVDTVALFAWGNWLPEKTLVSLPPQFIFVDCSLITPKCKFHQIKIDRSSGIKDAILFLLESGRSRIIRCGNIGTRAEGIEKAFRSFRGRGAEKILIETGGSEFKDGYNIGKSLMESNADAVFFDTDRMAFGFLKYAWEKGVRIPDDIAVVGFDDDPWGNYSCPSLSTVAHPIAEVNERIVELAKRRSAPPETIIFPTKFIKRQSV
jgi:DNA-binding LacI/PurR family transcriptional regulator